MTVSARCDPVPAVVAHSIMHTVMYVAGHHTDACADWALRRRQGDVSEPKGPPRARGNAATSSRLPCSNVCSWIPEGGVRIRGSGTLRQRLSGRNSQDRTQSDWAHISPLGGSREPLQALEAILMRLTEARGRRRLARPTWSASKPRRRRTPFREGSNVCLLSPLPNTPNIPWTTPRCDWIRASGRGLRTVLKIAFGRLSGSCVGPVYLIRLSR